MDKRDSLILAVIFTGAGIVVSLTILLANGVIGNPFLKN
jgi:hypothetical protein